MENRQQVSIRKNEREQRPKKARSESRRKSEIRHRRAVGGGRTEERGMARGQNSESESNAKFRNRNGLGRLEH